MTYYLKSFLYIIHRFVLRTPFLVGTSRKYDLKMKFRTEDGGGRKIYKKGIYEEDMSDFLLEELSSRDGKIIFDIGANIGWYSVLLGKHLGVAVDIYSFEPDPENFKCFQSNIERNKCTNIHSINKGVGEITEIKQLHLYKKSNVGRHSMLEINKGPTIDVPVVALDDFVAEYNLDPSQIRFIKIDIEGFELMAFKGARKVLPHVKMIMAEFSPGYMRKGGLDPSELIELLQGFGLSPHILTSNGIVPIDQDTLVSRNSNINLIWKRSG